MRDREIASREEREAALLANDMNRRTKLWKRAEGKRLNKVHLFGLLGSYALVCIGLFGLLGEGEIRPVLLAILGTISVVSFLYQFQQRQIDALREIVRELSGRS